MVFNKLIFLSFLKYDDDDDDNDDDDGDGVDDDDGDGVDDDDDFGCLPRMALPAVLRRESTAGIDLHNSPRIGPSGDDDVDDHR